jgi:co-chaperonin GroES (HSP10)
MIKPLGAMLLIKKIDKGDKVTTGGLVISAAFSDTGPKLGEVMDKGAGEANYKGEIIPIHEVDIGDKVYYPEHSGTEIEDEDGTKYLLMHSKNIIAKKI